MITDKKVSAVSDLLPALEKILQIAKNVVVIAEDVEGEALAAAVLVAEAVGEVVVGVARWGDR